MISNENVAKELITSLLEENNTSVNEDINEDMAYNTTDDDVDDISKIDQEISDEIEKLDNEDDKIYENDNNTEVVKSAYKQYIKSIGHFKVLTAEEEKELFKEIHNGSKEARKTLIEDNLKLVVHIAKQFTDYGMDIMDLIDEGNIGLMSTIDKFDVTRGTKFSTYATFWIRQAIQRYVENNGKLIRLPVHSLEKLSKISKAVRKFNSEFNRQPSLDEIVEETGIKKEKILELYQVSGDMLSLDAPIKNDEDSESTLGDFIPNQDNETLLNDGSSVEREEKRKAIYKALAILKTQERKVIELRFGLTGQHPMTLEEVGSIFNITRERVRQVEKKAMEKLSRPYIKRELKDFLDE